MFSLEIPDLELYDSEKMQFYTIEGGCFTFSYTLNKLYQWENRTNVRFIDNPELTIELLQDFVVFICNEELKPELVNEKVISMFMEEINNVTGPTVLPKRPNKGRKNILTSDIIYAYMYTLGIDTKWEYENLNKLLLLIAVVQDISNPPEKMSKEESIEAMRQQNEEMRRKYEGHI